MRFTKHTEEQLQVAGLIPAGLYQFRVAEAKEKVSASGNDMIELKLNILDGSNSNRVLFCYLLDAMPHLIKHFCDTTGLEMKYNDGTLLPTDCLNKSGYIEILIGKGKDKHGNTIDRNIIKDFLTADKYKELSQNNGEHKPFLDENSDLPF